jgi:RimJ/RimL family protein N-acetyltransferase
MMIVDLKTHPTVHKKQAIINHYPFLPYWWIRGITTESRQSLMDRELDKALTAEKACLLGYVSDENELLGFAQTRWLEWDTNHFEIEIWRLDHLGTWGPSSRQWAVAETLAQAVVQVAREQGVRNVQARIPIDNLPAIQALESVGFRTVEVLTTWIFDLSKSPIPPKRHPDAIRDFKPSDSETLIELARAAYAPTPDRFHADPHLSSKASSELYAEWMRNSCSGQMADHICVAEFNGEAVGYSTMKYLGDHEGLCNARIAQLGLGAISPQSRNNGIVTDTVIYHLEWLNQRQADYCLVGTQGNNIPPQRVWLKTGFRPATMELSLHYWMDD